MPGVAESAGVKDSGQVVANPGQIFSRFQDASFVFPHLLAGHPLFTLDFLKGFADRLPKMPGFLHWQTGKIDFGDGWDRIPANACP